MKMNERFSKRVENTVGKGEIAHYEQFLLFPQCFQKTCNADRKNQGLFWKGLKKKGTEAGMSHCDKQIDGPRLRVFLDFPCSFERVAK